MQVLPGALNVTTYFMLRKTSNGIAATGLTITGIDLQYTRSGVAPTAKVDATALVATDSAHGDNLAIEIDATDQPGLYRVDWPDAAFATGVREVILTVKEATIFTESQRINLEGPLTAMNAEMDKAIVDVGLDHLVAASVTGSDIVDNSIIARMVSKSATADWDSFTHTTDSLQAIQENGIASVAGAVGSVTGNVGGNVAGDVGGNVDGSIGSLAAQAKTDVNVEAKDVINTDIIAEQAQGQPPATPTLLQAIGWWWVDWRNASNATASERQVKNSAGTVATKAPLSDNATTFEKDKWVSGP